MTLELQRYADPVVFRDAVDEYLRSNINACNQLFIIVNNLTVEQAASRNAWLVRLHQSGKTCGLALISTALPLRLLNMSPMDDEGAALVAAALIADGIKLDGVHSSVLTAPLVAKHLGVQTTPRVRLGNHVLDTPPLLDACVGRMRAATLNDYDLLLAWEQAFVVECGLPVNNTALPAEIMERLKAPAPLMWIWEVGDIPVAMALGRPCRSVARIGMVYTVPDRRGRGYAGALVAALSAGLQAQGCSSIFLYTDLANRTSNGIYRRIGYRLLDELIHLDIK